VFKGDRGVAFDVGDLLQPLLGALQRALQPFDGQPSGGLGVLQLTAQVAELAVEVGLLRLRGQRKAFERRAGQDHGVPVAGRDAGDEQPAAVAGEVVGAGGEDAGLGVGLHPFAGELLQHVVGTTTAGF
jgi:hypothetical protein